MTLDQENTVKVLKDLHETLSKNVKHGYVSIIDVDQAKEMLHALDDRILNLTQGRVEGKRGTIKPTIENLRYKMRGNKLNMYQELDALIEFNKLLAYVDYLEDRGNKSESNEEV